MADCDCRRLDSRFDRRAANRDLDSYRRTGAPASSRLLIDELRARGVAGSWILDIGAGVGAVHLELLESGATAAVDVDASAHYLAAAREEASRLGLDERVDYRHGDFVALAEGLQPADIVVLDRVICCYADMERLVGRSAALARRLFGVVYPRDVWWVRVGNALMNLWSAARRTSFRTYVHGAPAVEATVAQAGLFPVFRRVSGLWQVVVFERRSQ